MKLMADGSGYYLLFVDDSHMDISRHLYLDLLRWGLEGCRCSGSGLVEDGNDCPDCAGMRAQLNQEDGQ